MDGSGLPTRAVILASGSRLRLRLFFVDSTPPRAAALEALSHLPIVVDYIHAIWDTSRRKRLISAVKYPERVCRRTSNFTNHDFRGDVQPTVSSYVFATPWLSGVSLPTLSPLLSATRTLVDLDTVSCQKGKSDVLCPTYVISECPCVFMAPAFP
jgi:hypothetical protein